MIDNEKQKLEDEIIYDILASGNIPVIYEYFGKDGVNVSIQMGAITKDEALDFYMQQKFLEEESSQNILKFEESNDLVSTMNEDLKKNSESMNKSFIESMEALDSLLENMKEEDISSILDILEETLDKYIEQVDLPEGSIIEEKIAEAQNQPPMSQDEYDKYRKAIEEYMEKEKVLSKCLNSSWSIYESDLSNESNKERAINNYYRILEKISKDNNIAIDKVIQIESDIQKERKLEKEKSIENPGPMDTIDKFKEHLNVTNLENKELLTSTINEFKNHLEKNQIEIEQINDIKEHLKAFLKEKLISENLQNTINEELQDFILNAPISNNPEVLHANNDLLEVVNRVRGTIEQEQSIQQEQETINNEVQNETEENENDSSYELG